MVIFVQSDTLLGEVVEVGTREVKIEAHRNIACERFNSGCASPRQVSKDVRAALFSIALASSHTGSVASAEADNAPGPGASSLILSTIARNDESAEVRFGSETRTVSWPAICSKASSAALESA